MLRSHTLLQQPTLDSSPLPHHQWYVLQDLGSPSYLLFLDAGTANMVKTKGDLPNDRQFVHRMTFPVLALRLARSPPGKLRHLRVYHVPPIMRLLRLDRRSRTGHGYSRKASGVTITPD
jgi:hypothetical protein